MKTLKSLQNLRHKLIHIKLKLKKHLNKHLFGKFLGYFMKGLLLVVPLMVTLYLISICLNWIDGLIGPDNIPGAGILILIVSITIFGYLGSTLLMKSIFESTEGIITKLPIINIIYSSMKEVMGAFMDNKRKIDRPVLVMIDPKTKTQRIGFITQEQLDTINLPGNCAVYMPHSYNFSGDLFIIPKSLVTPLNISSTKVMKFILSGGVTKI